jgi:D-glucosaminate-6-phosphate ammonia-lyase
VPLTELHDRIGERIATLVKAEAAMVSAGAASAMTLGTAGVLTGGDPKKVVDLPNLAEMKSEVIMQKAHRFGYDHAIRNCGVKIVEVDTAAELEAAITPQTAMMLFYNNNNSLGQIRDEEFVRLGKKHGVVTMNDCAADVPPVENLWKFTAMGFDLVAFSGGKGIRGPQSAGLLLGRKDLIAAARANAAPNGNAIGRGMKVNKEEMVGMLAAIERFVKLDHAALDREYQRRANVILKSLAGLKGVTASITVPEVANHVPHVKVVLDTAVTGITGQEISKQLRDGTPSIGVRPGDELLIGVWMMQPGEDVVVARRLKEVLTKKA